MRGYRVTAWVVAAAAVVGGAGCHRKPPSRPAAPQPPAPKRDFQPTVRASGISWTLPDPQGLPLWDMKAESGTGTTAQGVAELQKVRCSIYSGGKPSLEAKAARVKADYLGKRLTMYGGVDARTVDGKRTFRSERVTLTVKDEKRPVIDASGAIRMMVDGVEMAGGRLVTDPKLSEGQLLAQ